MSPSAATIGQAHAASHGLSWPARLESDQKAISARIPPHLVGLHVAVVERAEAGGAESLVLSGSTARGHRTEISDVDYHVVGGSISCGDLSRELDLHAVTPERLRSQVMSGDDFAHWSMRFGLVVFDHGPVREATALIVEHGLWPDVERKRTHAAKSLDLARRFVATGDQDAAVAQVRTSLSLAARAHLLGRGTFPLSRAELPAQLREAGRVDAGAALTRCIYDMPQLVELDRAVTVGAALLDAT